MIHGISESQDSLLNVYRFVGRQAATKCSNFVHPKWTVNFGNPCKLFEGSYFWDLLESIYNRFKLLAGFYLSIQPKKRRKKVCIYHYAIYRWHQLKFSIEFHKKIPVSDNAIPSSKRPCDITLKHVIFTELNL